MSEANVDRTTPGHRVRSLASDKQGHRLESTSPMSQPTRTAPPTPFILFSVLLGLGTALAAQSNAPSPELVKILRDSGICAASGECAGTPEQMEQLRKLGEKTEQW